MGKEKILLKGENMKCTVGGNGIGGLYWLFAVVYTFMKWGFWWGMLSIFLPIFPIIDLVKYFFK